MKWEGLCRNGYTSATLWVDPDADRVTVDLVTDEDTVELTPAQAREVAAFLVKCADELEGKSCHDAPGVTWELVGPCGRETSSFHGYWLAVEKAPRCWSWSVHEPNGLRRASGRTDTVEEAKALAEHVLRGRVSS